jgi:hypothetical protein
MNSMMLFVRIKNVKTMGCRIMVTSRFAANMVKIRQKIYCIAEHAANALRQREQPHFLDFIYQTKK